MPSRLKFRQFVLGLYMMISHFGSAQRESTLNFFDFRLPEIDSMLWDSPLSPRQITNKKIKKIEITQKKWRCVSRTSLVKDQRDSSKYYCNYECKVRSYFYDSLGLPVKIIVRDEAKPNEYNEYNCINTYNIDGKLLKSELYQVAIGDKSLTLISTNRREYNDQELLSVSEIYFSESEILRKRVYRYDYWGNIVQVFEDQGTHTLTEGPILHYDSSNRLIQSNDGPYSAVYFYDKSGLDSGFYKVLNKIRIEKTTIVGLEPGTTGTIVTVENFNKKGRRSQIKSELVSVREVKEGEILQWRYYYNKKTKQFAVSCQVSDSRTGFPIYTINNFWPLTQSNYQRNYFSDFFRFKILKTPGKRFRIKFPSQPNITEYTYTVM